MEEIKDEAVNTAADMAPAIPTKAKLLKDIDGNIKENQVKLIVEIYENGPYSRMVEAYLCDIEHFKRIKEALK